MHNLFVRLAVAVPVTIPPREEIVEKIKHYGETLGGNHWNLSPLLERLAAEGGALHQYSN